METSPFLDHDSATAASILSRSWDVIVIGSGAAGLSTALAAATATPTPAARVLVLDKAPAAWAGGNGYFTAGAYRAAHSGLEDIRALLGSEADLDAELAARTDLPVYSEEDFKADWTRLTGGKADEELLSIVVEESRDVVWWLRDVAKIRWELSFRRQAYEVEGRWRFWGGLCLGVKEGGKGLIATLAKAVRREGIEVVFGTEAKQVLLDAEGEVRGVEVERDGENSKVLAPSVVLCAGGFEASPELRRDWMGGGWEQARTRGTPYNTGDMLRAALALGARSAGDYSPTGCHSVAWDADAPRAGGDRERTNEFTKSGYPLGLMLNAHGFRFVDEGVDFRNYTYARFGRAILQQPGGVAFQLWDARGQEWLRAEEYRDDVVRKTTADSVDELAALLSSPSSSSSDSGIGLLDADQFVRTVSDFNTAANAHRAAHPDRTFNPAVRDGFSTTSLPLAKSNWALPVQEPPFLAVKVAAGITFTFGGLAIDPSDAAVLRSEEGKRFEGLYCAGEMVGGLFSGNYPGGSGLTAGAVFGRRAGRAAARKAADVRRKGER